MRAGKSVLYSRIQENPYLLNNQLYGNGLYIIRDKKIDNLNLNDVFKQSNNEYGFADICTVDSSVI